MSFSLQTSENIALTQSLSTAIDLGLITLEQAQSLCEQHSEEEVLLIIEQIASERMETGRQCIGDQCML